MVRWHAGAPRVHVAPHQAVAAVPRLHRRDARAREPHEAGRDRRFDRTHLISSDITVVVLTRNEARSIARALGSAPPGARLLVLDAESTDATAALAQAAGARVVVRPWAGFVHARRHAQSIVATPWTLMLDADEWLDAELCAAIASASPDAVAGYDMLRATYFCGKPMRGAGWGGERMLRLFKTAAARVEGHPAAGGTAELHERWVVAGPTRALAGVLHHDSYPTLASYREKFARYTSLEARGLRVTPSGVMLAFARSCARFPWLFLGRGGWRDGWRGAYVSAGSALYPLVVALKAATAR